MFLTPDDMIIISNFYSVVCTFRFSRGHLHKAVSAGRFCLFVCLFVYFFAFFLAQLTFYLRPCLLACLFVFFCV